MFLFANAVISWPFDSNSWISLHSEFLCCFHPILLFFFVETLSLLFHPHTGYVMWRQHKSFPPNMHAGGLSESQENFHEAQFVFAISSSTETQLAPAAVSQPQPRISDCFQAKRENLPFCLWGFFSGPFLPFSIVLGAASPGEASSNGEDYIAAIIEPSALPGHSSRLPSCCTFRGGAGPSVNSRLFFSSLFWRKDYFVLHFDRPSFTSPLCSLFWPPVWHKKKKKKKKKSLFSTCCRDFPCSRLEMPIMSYQDRGGRVNKILKQQCLLRLRLQVPDGDYGTVQIVVWSEIGGAVELWIRRRACRECKE